MQKFDLEEFLQNVFSNIVRKKAEKIIEQVAIHKKVFLSGNQIIIPLNIIFDKHEYTEEIIGSTLLAINSKEVLNCHCELNDDKSFLIIKLLKQ